MEHPRNSMQVVVDPFSSSNLHQEKICHYYLLTEISSNNLFRLHLPFSLSSSQIKSSKISLHVLHHRQESQSVLYLDFYFHLSLYGIGKGSILRDSESKNLLHYLYRRLFTI